MKPRLRFWLIAIATLAGVSITSSLGVWQLSRAAQKEAIRSAMDAQSSATPMVNQELFAQSEPPMYRRAVIRGTWMAKHTVFLDNRQMLGRVGFHVVTPLLLEDQNVAILVQRGWVPRNFTQRESLPDVETPQGVVQITGRMAPLPGKLYAFMEGESGAIRQNLDLDTAKKETGLPLVAFTLQQTGSPSEGLLREWPAINTGVDKHYGYALQWFGIGIVMIILFCWTQFVRPALQRRKKLQPHD